MVTRTERLVHRHPLRGPREAAYRLGAEDRQYEPVPQEHGTEAQAEKSPPVPQEHGN